MFGIRYRYCPDERSAGPAGATEVTIDREDGTNLFCISPSISDGKHTAVGRLIDGRWYELADMDVDELDQLIITLQRARNDCFVGDYEGRKLADLMWSRDLMWPSDEDDVLALFDQDADDTTETSVGGGVDQDVLDAIKLIKDGNVKQLIVRQGDTELTYVFG